MKILAIDPGSRESAYVIYNGVGVKLSAAIITDNETLLRELRKYSEASDITAVEMLASFGQRVGRDVFETAYWVGRFYQACLRSPVRVYRKDVAATLLGRKAKCSDKNIRAEILRRWGPGAKGTLRKPGPLFGVHDDMWSALAVAMAVEEWELQERRDVQADQQCEGPVTGSAQELRTGQSQCGGRRLVEEILREPAWIGACAVPVRPHHQ